MTGPLKADMAARAARERAALASARRDAALALQACAQILVLLDRGYVLFPLAVDEVGGQYGMHHFAQRQLESACMQRDGASALRVCTLYLSLLGKGYVWFPFGVDAYSGGRP